MFQILIEINQIWPDQFKLRNELVKIIIIILIKYLFIYLFIFIYLFRKKKKRQATCITLK
jgi:hypothetical protein